MPNLFEGFVKGAGGGGGGAVKVAQVSTTGTISLDQDSTDVDYHLAAISAASHADGTDVSFIGIDPDDDTVLRFDEGTYLILVQVSVTDIVSVQYAGPRIHSPSGRRFFSQIFTPVTGATVSANTVDPTTQPDLSTAFILSADSSNNAGLQLGISIGGAATYSLSGTPLSFTVIKL